MKHHNLVLLILCTQFSFGVCNAMYTEGIGAVTEDFSLNLCYPDSSGSRTSEEYFQQALPHKKLFVALCLMMGCLATSVVILICESTGTCH